MQKERFFFCILNLMSIQIDQSGKVEQTDKDTVIALSNDENNQSKTLLIKAKDKRKLQEIFRENKIGKLFVYRVFAGLVFLLIKDISKTSQVVIDVEYHGKENLIREVLMEFYSRAKILPPDIVFRRIGNTPRVHYAAYNVFIGKLKPDVIVSLAKIGALTIKKDRGPKD